MEKIKVFAAAKINLTLDVLNRRPDGYHNLATVMHEIPLADDITLTLEEASGVRAVTNVPYIRTETNIAAKAGKRFLDQLSEKGVSPEELPGITVEIKKRIPVGAGLGGGSADAAAVLKALNDHFHNPFPMPELMAIGKSLGADVPFCIQGGCALCEGIGEIITPQEPLHAGYLVLVKPKTSISTAELFSHLRVSRKQMRPDTAGTLKALSERDLNGVAKRVFNVLEEAAEKHCRDIPEIHQELIRAGALGASMSGSGSTVYGLFESEEPAQMAAEHFGKRYKDTFFLKF